MFPGIGPTLSSPVTDLAAWTALNLEVGALTAALATSPILSKTGFSTFAGSWPWKVSTPGLPRRLTPRS